MVHFYYMASLSEQLKASVELAAVSLSISRVLLPRIRDQGLRLNRRFLRAESRRMLDESLTGCKHDAHLVG